MNIRLRRALAPVLAVIACLSVAWPTPGHDRVHQICVIAGDIDACVPQDA